MKKIFRCLNDSYPNHNNVSLSSNFVRRWISVFLIVFVLCFQYSCKKFLDTDLNRSTVSAETAYSDESTANFVMNGMYAQLRNGRLAGGGSDGLSLLGLSADEFDNVLQSNDYNFFKLNNIPVNDNKVMTLWTDAYVAIYQANDIIEQIEKSTKLSTATRNQFLGEAYFVRAFAHFLLTNIFGEIPLVITTDIEMNSRISRSSVSTIYQQIKSDLINAQSLMSDSYQFNERIRPNKYAAAALLARVYLYNKEWDNAEKQATLVIGSPLYGIVTNLDAVFLKASKEVIWQLASTDNGGFNNTNEALSFVIDMTPYEDKKTLSPELLAAFEPNDKRRTHWVGSFDDGANVYIFPYKYKAYVYGDPLTEHFVVLRLSEQYLIRAEARLNKNDTNGAKSDLNIVRSRAGLPNTPAQTASEISNAIFHERQVELFSEWGHRWFDLKRLNLANQALSPIKGATWQSSDQLYPIPSEEIRKNGNLTQNIGY